MGRKGIWRGLLVLLVDHSCWIQFVQYGGFEDIYESKYMEEKWLSYWGAT